MPEVALGPSRVGGAHVDAPPSEGGEGEGAAGGEEGEAVAEAPVIILLGEGGRVGGGRGAGRGERESVRDREG